MISINTHDAKTRLSQLLKQVEETGESFWICRGGKPIAELRPIQKKAIDPLKTYPDLKIDILEDPTLPLDPEDWPDEYR